MIARLGQRTPNPIIYPLYSHYVTAISLGTPHINPHKLQGPYEGSLLKSLDPSIKTGHPHSRNHPGQLELVAGSPSSGRMHKILPNKLYELSIPLNSPYS